MTIHTRINRQTGLAKFYAKDGAFRTAAAILRDLAEEMVDHADYCDHALEAAIEQARLVRTVKS